MLSEEVTSDDALKDLSDFSIHGQHVTDATGPPSFFLSCLFIWVHQVLTCGMQDQLP